MDLIQLLWIFLIVVFCVLLMDYLPRLLPSYRVAKSLPGPDIRHFWSALWILYGLTPITSFQLPRDWKKQFKQTYSVWAFGRSTVAVFKASVIETILATSKHTHKGAVYQILKPFLGEGLLISNDRKWLQRRRILTPAFHFSILQQFLAVFREERKKLRHQLEVSTESELEVDLASTMSRFTLNTICETSMGVKLDSLTGADKYRQSIYDLAQLILERFLRPWLHLPSIYRWSTNRYRMERLLKPVHSFTRDVIQRHRKHAANVTHSGHSTTDNIYDEKKQRFAMLGTLLSAESRGEIDAAGIEEEVGTIMFEGHDTTSAALIFIFLLLAHHPDVQERVYEEIKSIVEENNLEPLNMTSYNKMSYTDRVIKESMRIYPPVPFISRDLTEDVTIETGQKLPKGTECHLHIFDLHRDEEQFPDPEKFDPDRFLPELVQKRHPFAYLPFSAGPRNCIGQKFAMLELKSCLEEVLMHFQIRPITQREDIVFISDLVLRSEKPVKVKMLNRRNVQ